MVITESERFDESPAEVPSHLPEESTDLSPQFDQPSSSTSPSFAENTKMDSSSSLFSVDETKKPLVGAGLANLGNTCFLNAVLQCFTHTVPFVESLRSLQHENPCCRASEGFCVLCALREHIEDSLASSGGTIWPYKLVDNLSYLSSSFQRYQQEDAHEFLQCFLDKLDTCCLEVNKKDQSSSSQEDSFVKKIFGGRLRSQLQCGNCGHCSDTFEPLIDLSLEIEDVDTLPTALESFTKVEKIEETKFTCENCKEEVSMEKQFTLEQTPSVAAFHLKRFKNDGSYVEKIDKYVEYPLELDLQPYTSSRESNDVEVKYELFAVVVHSGFYSWSGHYFSFIRSSPETWHQLDDSTVTRVREEFVLSQEAYILFYAKKGTPWFSSLMETQKQFTEKSSNTSPKSVLDDVDRILTRYPVSANNFKENVVGARDDEGRMPTARPVGNCSINIMKETYGVDVGKDTYVLDVRKDANDVDVRKGRNDVDVTKDGNDVDVLKDRSNVGYMEDRNDVNVCPRTPPYSSPSPDNIYSEETPEVSYLIPRDHLKLKNQTPSAKQASKALEDTKRKEALRLTRSMPSARAMKFRACMEGPKSESSVNKKKRKIGFSGDVGSGRKDNSGACRKLNPSILHSVAPINFS